MGKVKVFCPLWTLEQLAHTLFTDAPVCPYNSEVFTPYYEHS